MRIASLKTIMTATALSVLSGFTMGQTAQAATISAGGFGSATCYEAGSITTMASCSGYLFGAGGTNAVAGQISGTNADLWDIVAVTGLNKKNEENEANLLNLVTGTTSFGKDDMSKTGGNSGSMTFSFSHLYALIKIGGGSTGSYVILRNDAGKTIDVSWSAGTSGGLSHETQAGGLTTPVPVPTPAAGVLLIGALGGLGLMRRRRKA